MLTYRSNHIMLYLVLLLGSSVVIMLDLIQVYLNIFVGFGRTANAQHMLKPSGAKTSRGTTKKTLSSVRFSKLLGQLLRNQLISPTWLQNLQP